MTQQKSYSDISVGDSVSFTVEITEELHNSFSVISGDKGPIHTDPEFAKKNNFDDKIGYAFLLSSFLSRLYGEHLPGGSSICIKQTTKFIKPYFVGDIITIQAKVVHKSDSTKIIEIESEMFRNETEKIFKGNGVVKALF